MKILLLLPLLLGFSVPAIAHNEANGGCGTHCDVGNTVEPFVNDDGDAMTFGGAMGEGGEGGESGDAKIFGGVLRIERD